MRPSFPASRALIRVTVLALAWTLLGTALATPARAQFVFGPEAGRVVKAWVPSLTLGLKSLRPPLRLDRVSISYNEVSLEVGVDGVEPSGCTLVLSHPSAATCSSPAVVGNTHACWTGDGCPEPAAQTDALNAAGSLSLPWRAGAGGADAKSKTRDLRHAIRPGHERAVQRALAPPAGSALQPRGVSIEAAHIEARFVAPGETPDLCATARVCVVLTHPEGDAPAFASEPIARLDHLAVYARGEGAASLVQELTPQLKTLPAGLWKVLGKRAPPPKKGALVASDAPANASEQDARFRALLKGDADLTARILTLELSAHSAVYTVRTDRGNPLVMTLTDRPATRSNPLETTAHFLVLSRGGIVEPPDLPERFRAALRRGDDGSLRLQPRAQEAQEEGQDGLTRLLILVSTLAWILLGLLLIPMLIVAARRIGPDRWVWTAIALGAALRLALPARFVEMGIAFQLTDMAGDLVLPRYGAGVITLHHGVFSVFGIDHLVMTTLHKVLGALTLPLSIAVGIGLMGQMGSASRLRWQGRAFAIALSLTPMLVRSDLTESNLVPVFFALFMGLLAWTESRGVLRAAGTFAGLGVAMLSRPELVVVIPAVWLLLTRPWARDPTDPGKRRVFVAILVGLIALAPAQIIHVLRVTARELGDASLKLGADFFSTHLWAHLAETALWDPTIVPLGTFLLAIAALWLAPRDRARIALWLGGGLLWIAIYAVDLSSASPARLHVTGLIFWSLGAAVGLGALATRAQKWARPLALGLSLFWVLSAAATIPTLWAPTNEDTEIANLDRLVAQLPPDPAPVLARLSSGDAPDAPGHYTQRHFPDYRFESITLTNLADLHQHLARPGGPPVYYYQGVSCYARLGRQASGSSGLLRPCIRVHETFRLEPVDIRTVPNMGNPRHQHLGYYGPGPVFEQGLWRVHPPAPR